MTSNALKLGLRLRLVTRLNRFLMSFIVVDVTLAFLEEKIEVVFLFGSMYTQARMETLLMRCAYVITTCFPSGTHWPGRHLPGPRCVPILIETIIGERTAVERT